MLGDYEGFTAKNKHYFLVCVDEIEDDDLREMINMGNHIQVAGDHEVATFVPNVHNSLTGFIDGQNCVLFQFPQYFSRSKREKTLGHELARFHNRGKAYQKQKKHEGTWSQFWIRRLSQLDIAYQNIATQKQKSTFDQMFMTSFPYYLGRTENAIQYIVDTDLDFGDQFGNETKTICHYKFSERTWLTIDDKTNAGVKSPIEFVYDHSSRDLAEWIREVGTTEDAYEKINHFIKEYEQVQVISPKTWRYIYARLLFPIDYYQIIEGYYRSIQDEFIEDYTDQLLKLFSEEKKAENFLREFHDRIIPSSLQQYIPKVDWLSTLKNTDNRQYY